MKKQLGFIGLGKMGQNMVLRLQEKGWRVLSFDVNGKGNTKSIEALVNSLATPRLVWLMVPSVVPLRRTTEGKASSNPVVDVLHQLVPLLSRDDVVIDGGNSFYEDSIKRAKKFSTKGIHFLDVGVSGGPKGARQGACLMIGGEKSVYENVKPLFEDLATKNGYAYMGKSGAGHFVKMVHNGIEYGMMQAIAEGFAVMKKSPFRLNLQEIAKLYNHGSVIESRLVGWLEHAFEQFGADLKDVSGSVGHTGEGEWTLKTAKKLGVEAPAIENSVKFRVDSAKKPNYAGKILSALRNQFGGHSIK